MADDEYHVASFVVRARPDDTDGVADRIRSIAGLEVHAGEKGKLIVTAEAGDVRALAELTGQLESLPGVIAAAPVYHEFTSEAEGADSAARNPHGASGARSQ